MFCLADLAGLAEHPLFRVLGRVSRVDCRKRVVCLEIALRVQIQKHSSRAGAPRHGQHRLDFAILWSAKRYDQVPCVALVVNLSNRLILRQASLIHGRRNPVLG